MYSFNFADLQWEPPLPEVRFKALSRNGKKLKIAEFTQDFVELDWCIKGHMDLVLSGELEIDFNGNVVRFPEGSGYLYSFRF